MPAIRFGRYLAEDHTRALTARHPIKTTGCALEGGLTKAEVQTLRRLISELDNPLETLALIAPLAKNG
jgi:hypothetical protein